MKVKIDTKEVFHVINIEDSVLTAIMAAELLEIVNKKQTENKLSLVLNFSHVEEIDASFLTVLHDLHQIQQ
ncbi:MAG: hypothetical protein RLZZ333_1786, partial [Bacteroidota bacterium]